MDLFNQHRIPQGGAKSLGSFYQVGVEAAASGPWAELQENVSSSSGAKKSSPPSLEKIN